MEPVEQVEGVQEPELEENLEVELVNMHSIPLSTEYFAMDLSSRQESNSSSSSSTISPNFLNFILSDSNAVCSQLFFGSVKYERESRRLTSAVLNRKTVEARRRRQKRRYKYSQRSRAAERLRKRMSRNKIQRVAKNPTLQTQLGILQDMTSSLMELLRNLVHQLQKH